MLVYVPKKEKHTFVIELCMGSKMWKQQTSTQSVGHEYTFDIYTKWKFTVTERICPLRKSERFHKNFEDQSLDTQRYKLAK